jgi:hypothetical protein
MPDLHHTFLISCSHQSEHIWLVTASLLLCSHTTCACSTDMHLAPSPPLLLLSVPADSWRSTPTPAASSGDRFASYSSSRPAAGSSSRGSGSPGAKLGAGDLAHLPIDDLRDLVKKLGTELPREPTRDNVINGLIQKGVSLNDLTRGEHTLFFTFLLLLSLSCTISVGCSLAQAHAEPAAQQQRLLAFQPAQQSAASATPSAAPSSSLPDPCTALVPALVPCPQACWSPCPPSWVPPWPRMLRA